MVWATGMACARAKVHAASAQQDRPLGVGEQPGSARHIVGGRTATDGRCRLVARVDRELALLEG
jgi:hypothetical protein